MQPSAISLTWNNALNSSFVVLFLSKGPDTTTVIQIFFPSRAGLVTVLNLKHFLWYRKQRDFREQPSAIKGRKKIVQRQFSNVLMQCSDVLNFTKIVILLINIYIVHMFTIYFKDILSSVNFLSVSTMIFYYKLITLGKSRADNECNYFDLLAKQLRSNALQTYIAVLRITSKQNRTRFYESNFMICSSSFCTPSNYNYFSAASYCLASDGW